MSLEVIHGEARHRALAVRLADSLAALVDDGTIYLGYPVFAAGDDRVSVDALLVSRSVGLIAFLLRESVPDSPDEWSETVEEQDRLFAVLEGYLSRHDSLRRGRRLSVEIETATVFPAEVSSPPGVSDGHYIDFSGLEHLVAEASPLDEDVAPSLLAALERVASIKPAKRRSRVSRSDSRGAVIRTLERQIANLDEFQKHAAIESPEGPQRIRGLAGSGKTVVLALKAAYLHTQHPTWTIGVTFFSRALYQQFRNLIARFCFESTGEAPDFDFVRVMHCWGASGQNGIYRTVASSAGATFRDWRYAQATWGRDDAFQGACRELLDIVSISSPEPIFDALLIDEAQDLPAEFFQLAYSVVKEPKRIVWAFDELQNLSSAEMPATDELFGRDANGDPLVSVENEPGQARRDVVLPICYRNPPWTLATAHAIGFGIYAEGGLVQHFDNIDLWTEIGYKKVSGSLRGGRRVTLERSADSYPDFIPELLTPEDSLQLKLFDRQTQQDEWVAKAIAENLANDELDHDDIAIVLPDARTSKSRASAIGRALARHQIASHLVGVGSAVDEFWVENSISISHIYRAKGNEAPMVYVMDAHQAVATQSAEVSGRNTLFTAITRSRAWVRVCAWGVFATPLESEFDAVRENDFRLAFKVPTVSERARLRRVHRERSAEETAAIQRTADDLSRVVEALDSDELTVDDLPEEIRQRLRNYLSEPDLADD